MTTEAKDRFLDTAVALGAQLCREAIWDRTRCNWLGDSIEFVGQAWVVVHRSFGPDLYGGTSGIALFLTRLFNLTGERVFRVVAEGGIQQALSRLEDLGPANQIGFYTGATGVAYTLFELGEALRHEGYRARAMEMLADLCAYDPDGQPLDIIAGSAGLIPVLLNIHRRQPTDFLLDLAVRHADHLLRTARVSQYGWSWNTLAMPNTPPQNDLTGFAHGAAGIAWALLELYQQTGDGKYRHAAEQGLLYEKNWFNPQYSNWPDLRNLSDPTAATREIGYTTAWCHGAPGIGLSRLRVAQILDYKSFQEDLEAALRTTRSYFELTAYPQQGNLSLCHGRGGNAELLLSAGLQAGQEAYRAEAEQIGDLGIQTYHKPELPWPCGVPGGGETPGLMLGLAGIGYFYLRLYDPAKTPSILLVH